jgi:hypothetical protein
MQQYFERAYPKNQPQPGIVYAKEAIGGKPSSMQGNFDRTEQLQEFTPLSFTQVTKLPSVFQTSK